MGLDTELSYEKKWFLATLAIQKGRCLLGPIQIRTFRQKEALLPGAGSVVTFVETATQTKTSLYWQTKSDYHGTSDCAFRRRKRASNYGWR